MKKFVIGRFAEGGESVRASRANFVGNEREDFGGFLARVISNTKLIFLKAGTGETKQWHLILIYVVPHQMIKCTNLAFQV